MNKKSIVIYQAWAKVLLKLPNDKAGELIKMICDYAFEGIKNSSDDVSLNATFEMICDRLDEDNEKYKKKVESVSNARTNIKRTENRLNSDRNQSEINSKTDTVTDTVTDKKDSVFIPPSLEDVIEYFKEQGISDETKARKFFNNYSSKGWKVSNTKMTDWKARVNYWISNDKEEKSSVKKNGFNSFDAQRSYDYNDLEKILVANQ